MKVTKSPRELGSKPADREAGTQGPARSLPAAVPGVVSSDSEEADAAAEWERHLDAGRLG